MNVVWQLGAFALGVMFVAQGRFLAAGMAFAFVVADLAYGWRRA